MKKRYFIVIIGVLLHFTACKNFLETTPIDALSPENYYETEAQLRSALAGVYDRMARPQTFGDQMLGRMGLEGRSEEHTSELQSREKIVCRLLLEKKKTIEQKLQQ